MKVFMADYGNKIAGIGGICCRELKKTSLYFIEATVKLVGVPSCPFCDKEFEVIDVKLPEEEDEKEEDKVA